MSEQNQTPSENHSGAHAFFEIDTEAWKNMNQSERLQYASAIREQMIRQMFEDFVDESDQESPEQSDEDQATK